MSTPQFNLTYSTSDSTFSIKVYDVATVKYNLSYMAQEPMENTTDSPGEVAHGFTGSGNAVRGVYSAEQVAGTKSGDDIVYHVVKSGTLDLSGTSTDGSSFKLSRNFTVDTNGKLTLTESLGSVLGAETATPSTELMMATPAADMEMMAEPRVTTLQVPVEAPATQELTVTPVGAASKPEVPTLVLLAGVIMIGLGVAAGIVWWVKRKKTS